jgi:hypothetical protein
MVTDQDFDRGMTRWNELRKQLAEANAAKDHLEVVRVCDEIVAFATANPRIRVVEFLFHKRAAKSLEALGWLPAAIARIDQAIAGCKHYRATAKLREPDDFLRDVVALERLQARWRKRAAAGTSRT